MVPGVWPPAADASHHRNSQRDLQDRRNITNGRKPANRQLLDTMPPFPAVPRLVLPGSALLLLENDSPMY